MTRSVYKVDLTLGIDIFYPYKYQVDLHRLDVNRVDLGRSTQTRSMQGRS